MYNTYLYIGWMHNYVYIKGVAAWESLISDLEYGKHLSIIFKTESSQGNLRCDRRSREFLGGTPGNDKIQKPINVLLTWALSFCWHFKLHIKHHLAPLSSISYYTLKYSYILLSKYIDFFTSKAS